jgi:predicted nucleic acid-binding protein
MATLAAKLRVYVDTSAVGGCLEPQFATDSNRLFELARQGRLILVASDVVFDELELAPAAVRDILTGMPSSAVERISLDDEIVKLRDAYLRAGIVSERWKDDATHVAAAAVARVDAIVSWNTRHIVRLDRIKAYNQVNVGLGYGRLTILSPREVRDVGLDES